TDEAAAFDRADRIQPAPLIEQLAVDVAFHRRGPKHAALVLARDFDRTGQSCEIRLPRSRAFVVAHAGNHAAALVHGIDRARHQRTRLIALSRRQHHDERKLACKRACFAAYLESRAYECIRIRLERLLAHEPRPRSLPQRPTVTRTQEQCAPVRPLQPAFDERPNERFECGIGLNRSVEVRCNAGWMKRRLRDYTLHLTRHTRASARCSTRTGLPVAAPRRRACKPDCPPSNSARASLRPHCLP